MKSERKTVLRTIRISKEIDGLLKKDAEANGISVNALIYSIMMKYSEWDRFADKYNLINLSNMAFKTILETVEDEEISKIGEIAGGNIVKGNILFWFKEATLESFLALIAMYSKYSGLYIHEFETRNGMNILSFRHDLGNKWSIFLSSFIGKSIEETLGATPKTSICGNTVTFTFPQKD